MPQYYTIPQKWPRSGVTFHFTSTNDARALHTRAHCPKSQKGLEHTNAFAVKFVLFCPKRGKGLEHTNAHLLQN